jgi:xylose isomerase
MGFFCDNRRRESTDVEDMFLAHISGMDTLARGLRNVAKLIEVTGNTLRPTELFPCRGF